MPLSLKALAKGTADVTVHVFGETANVSYRVCERTPVKDANINDETLVEFVVRVVAKWDVLGEDDKTPVPLTAEAVENVPTPILRAVVRTIVEDRGLGEAPASSASG